MNTKYLYSFLIILVVVLGLVKFISARNQNKVAENNDKLSVAASFYPLYFFSSEIGGDKAVVTNITPPAAEPHDYEPTAEDIAQIENSKLLILNGGGLEAWGEDMKKNLNPKNTSIVVAGVGLTDQKVLEDGENITDPHIWLAPLLAEKVVDRIADGFIKSDPANKDYYLANAATLKNKLGELDVAYKNGLSNCLQKNIITSHAAFGYLSTAYNLKQVPITGLSPDSEPSSKQLADIAEFAKLNHVKYIFFESLVSPKLSETIAKEVGAQTMVLNPIEGLSNEEISAGKNYFTEMENNLNNLRIVLQCQ